MYVGGRKLSVSFNGGLTGCSRIKGKTEFQYNFLYKPEHTDENDKRSQ